MQLASSFRTLADTTVDIERAEADWFDTVNDKFNYRIANGENTWKVTLTSENRFSPCSVSKAVVYVKVTARTNACEAANCQSCLELKPGEANKCHTGGGHNTLEKCAAKAKDPKKIAEGKDHVWCGDGRSEDMVTVGEGGDECRPAVRARREGDARQFDRIGARGRRWEGVEFGLKASSSLGTLGTVPLGAVS